MALSKKNRLRSSAEIKAVLKCGKIASNDLATVRYFARPKGQLNKFAFVVSSSVAKKSFIRNTIRRRAAEFIRVNPKAFYSGGYDVVVIFKAAAGKISKKDFYSYLNELLS